MTEILTYFDIIPEDLIYELCLILKNKHNFPFTSKATLKVYLQYLRNLWKGYLFNFDPINVKLTEHGVYGIYFLPYLKIGEEMMEISVRTDYDLEQEPEMPISYIQNNLKEIYGYYLDSEYYTSAKSDTLLGKLNNGDYVCYEIYRSVDFETGNNYYMITIVYSMSSFLIPRDQKGPFKNWKFMRNDTLMTSFFYYVFIKDQKYSKVIDKLYEHFRIDDSRSQ